MDHIYHSGAAVTCLKVQLRLIAKDLYVPVYSAVTDLAFEPL